MICKTASYSGHPIAKFYNTLSNQPIVHCKDMLKEKCNALVIQFSYPEYAFCNVSRQQFHEN